VGPSNPIWVHGSWKRDPIYVGDEENCVTPHPTR
jgi:hypothetical protein